MIPHVHAADTSERNQSRGWRALLLVIMLAAALRAAWMIEIPVVPVSDSVRYDFFAQRLAQNLGYTESDGRRTAYWPVGPSFLFSLCYRITGWESEQRFLPIAIMNLLMGTASVGLTAHLGRKWFSARVGLLAGLLLALWPSQIEFTTVLASETPMIFFLLAGLAAWYADRWPWWLRGVLAGVFFAAASFMRPTALLVPVVVALADLVGGPRRLQTMGRLILVAAAMAACIAPWTYRNYRVFNAFVPISTNGGVNFWMGNNPETTGSYQPPPWDCFATEVKRDRGLRNEALAHIRAQLAAFFKRTLLKAVRLHERESIGVTWNEPGLERALERLGLPATRIARLTTAPPGADGDSSRKMASAGPATSADLLIFGLKLVSNAYWWAILLLAALGLLRLAWSGKWLLALFGPPTLLWAYFTAVHAATVIQDRYHFAAVPAVALLTATLVLSNERCAAEAVGHSPG